MNSTPIQPSQRTLHMVPATICKVEPDPFQVADSYTEKVVVGTLMAIDALSYISPFRWLPYLTRCGGPTETSDGGAENENNLTACLKDTDCREPRICEGGKCLLNQSQHIGEENSMCLDTLHVSTQLFNGKTYMYECDSGTECQEGACTTSRGQEDFRCPEGLKGSRCVVSDFLDLYEESGHQNDLCQGVCTDGYLTRLCGADGGLQIGGEGCYGSCSPIHASMGIYPPPEANYYRVDAKLWIEEGARSRFNQDHKLLVEFGGTGGTQMHDLSPSIEGDAMCGFQELGYFPPIGTTGNKAEIRMYENWYYGHSSELKWHDVMFVTQLRIWSCRCN